MPETAPARVAVYLDFDNIVISWFDRVHGRNAYGRERQRLAEGPLDDDLARKLEEAMVEVGAIIDYAASFGTLVLTRAYADWSSPVNAGYQSQLVARAVDLVQLFPAAAYAKNGADIRLAVDAVEDMFRLPDLTHVVIVSGDSDYVPLAQRCKRLGRHVVGVGVAGSTARSLAAACDEFEVYDSLPGVQVPTAEAKAKPQGKAKASRRRGSEEEGVDEATRLLQRALRLGHDKNGDEEWLHSSEIKQLMRRMDPSFSEKSLGFRSFNDFVKSRDRVAELEESGHERMVRLIDS